MKGARQVYFLARTLGATRFTACRFTAGYCLEQLGGTLMGVAEWWARRITPQEYHQ